ncbi:MAG: hypothetical protein Q9201_007339 [Fulgogasparrea decipioides]
MLVGVWLSPILLSWGNRLWGLAAPTREQPCPRYDEYAKYRNHEPFSEGRHRLPYQRPIEKCRTFPSPAVENTLFRLKNKIADPDLFRLFENTYPNTLDTAVLWTGFAWENGTRGRNTDEDLANAMWLRDSANQVLSYLPLLEPSASPKSIAALFRGLINLQSRYIKITPYCHAFQPPPESGIPLGTNLAYYQNNVNPPYDPNKTFDCKWELDSLASFLHMSSEYYNATKDIRPFTKYRWVETVRVILDAVEAMRTATYTPDGENSCKCLRLERRVDGKQDTLLQFLIPSNMMFARYLEAASLIMSRIPTQEATNLTIRMRAMASEIRAGITDHGIVHHPLFGPIFAFEVDGYGSRNLMDDANLPSLLSAAMMGYVSPRDEVYLNSRLFALSTENPYWMHGSTLSAVGGPHLGPMKSWPLASIVRAMTSDDGSGEEVKEEIIAILNTTDGLGLIHESVKSWDVKDWTRRWFSWANGMFGQLILDVEKTRPFLLAESFQ